MSPTPRHRLALAACVLAGAVPLTAVAQGREPPPDGESAADHRQLSDAVRRAERATNGQVLSAERVQFDGRDLSRVKVIDERGRVRVYWDDPQASRERAREAREREARESRRDARRGQREQSDPRSAEPPRRTRRHDGPAFNL